MLLVALQLADIVLEAHVNLDLNFIFFLGLKSLLLLPLRDRTNVPLRKRASSVQRDEKSGQWERSLLCAHLLTRRRRQHVCSIPIFFCIMSLCRDLGKDKVIFVTKEDHESESNYVLPPDDEPRGLILPNGDINWNCPCIGSTASGPCGYEFREAFSCFHYSRSDTKGSECAPKFAALNQCMSEFPTIYSRSREEQELEQESYDRDKLDAELRSLEERELLASSEKQQSSPTDEKVTK